MPTVAALLAVASVLCAQEPVLPAGDPEALFHSSDAKLDKNKQAAYHIVKDLLQAGHWELADKYLTERYVQHNPNAASGRDGVVRFFTEVRKVTPRPIPDKMTTKVVSVAAEGDLVVVTLRARHEGSRGSDEDLHHDMVRHVALQGRQGGRALGSSGPHGSMSSPFPSVPGRIEPLRARRS